ncbi:hypothetical protein EN851_19515 [Mesorhizobium sp. M8A.F.Ca.ET.208.01.1.1]|uniref:hypothetical protein n=1 Tax=unclassified Mesorhizobium TaxID=325217 RepID=UPI001093FAFB|nr:MULTISPECIES: hypothetical protein [unclassified Mesorhizobium]TGQ79501.1 hypothetical protein EN850_15600 [Mesorhizobium sp. M8A.F.Ca.ET.207.01.1.1]TGQ91346.1 hypothetical protein EN851_19515 [Mesorhizobium sp. M8A.F.Ca.ET.208.01.1.1]TGT51690.1 hypothetical protein EN810_19505 [Mesorhizobium sp. M8A.F.Ca.ET.167.01.1.1]TIT64576.1 MAG: hypothetical protein E5W90_21870 [Mesorhizobium sp.]
MRDRFFILFEARSGSSHLVSLLNSSPNVICYSEIFAGQSLDVCDQLLHALEAEAPLHNLNPWVLDDYGSVDPEKEAMCVGFKAKPYDLPSSRTLDKLEEMGFKLILLTRRNIIKQAVSRSTGLKLWNKIGLYNAPVGGDTISSITIDPLEIIEIAEICDEVRTNLLSTLDRWKNQTLQIEYEDLLYREDFVLKNLARFLSIPEFQSFSKTTKNTLDDLSMALDNYDELVKVLKNHKFEMYLK